MIVTLLIAILVIGLACWLAEVLIPAEAPKRIVQVAVTLAAIGSVFHFQHRWW